MKKLQELLMGIQKNPKADQRICSCLEEEMINKKNIKKNQKEWAPILCMFTEQL